MKIFRKVLIGQYPRMKEEFHKSSFHRNIGNPNRTSAWGSAGTWSMEWWGRKIFLSIRFLTILLVTTYVATIPNSVHHHSDDVANNEQPRVRTHHGAYRILLELRTLKLCICFWNLSLLHNTFRNTGIIIIIRSSHRQLPNIIAFSNANRRRRQTQIHTVVIFIFSTVGHHNPLHKLFLSV